MTLQRVKEILDAEVHACEEKLGRSVESGCGSDLMSDVLAFSKDKAIMLTGLVNPQVIRTAEMMDMRAVCFVRGKKPGPEILSLAEEKGMVVMTTGYMMYDACGLLRLNGLGAGNTNELKADVCGEVIPNEA